MKMASNKNKTKKKKLKKETEKQKPNIYDMLKSTYIFDTF